MKKTILKQSSDYLRGGVILFCALVSFNVFAQQSEAQFMTVLSKTHEGSLKKEYAPLLKLIKKDAKSYDFIKVALLKDHLKDGKISFSLGDLTGLVTKLGSLNYVDEKNYNLYGDIYGNHEGFIQLSSDTTGIFGQIQLGDKKYEIISLSDHESALLVEVDNKKGLLCNQNEKGTKRPKLTDEEIAERSMPCNSLNKIRVLFVYTQNALTAAGGLVSTIHNRVNTCVNSFNQARTNSGVASIFAEIDIAGIEATAYAEGALQNMLTTYPNREAIFAGLVTATSLRKAQTNADVLFVLSDFNNPESAGMVRNIGTFTDADTYAWGDIDQMPGEPIIQHEIGHLLNGYHGDDTFSQIDNHGHTYIKSCFLCSTTIRATFMQPQVPNAQRPARWSNPAINDIGRPTGVAGLSNMAYHVNQNADDLSFIRLNTTLYSSLIGPTQVTSMGNYTYTVEHNGCSYGHTFIWQTSSDGITYYNTGSTGTTHSQFFYPGTSSPLYVRCLVNGGDGQQSVSNLITYHYISYKVKANHTIVDKIDLYPNPVNNELEVMLQGNEDKDGVIEIVNQMGQVVIKESINRGAGVRKKTIKVSDLVPGTFTLLLKEGEEFYGKNFIKQ
jgi:hypothetical protein